MSILLVVPNPSVFKYVIDRALPVPIPKVIIVSGQSLRVSSSSGANGGGGGASDTIFRVKAGPISGMYPANGIVKTCELEVRVLKGRDPSLCVFVYSQEERVNWTLEGTNGVYIALTPMIDAIRRCMESPGEELVNEDSSSDAEIHRQYAQLAGERERLAIAETRQIFGLPALSRLETHPRSRPETPPRIILGLASLAAFNSLLYRMGLPSTSVLSFQTSRFLLYRAQIDPGITSDDYIWCGFPRSVNASVVDISTEILEWVDSNGDEAYGLILVSGPGSSGTAIRSQRVKCVSTLPALEECLARLISGDGGERQLPQQAEAARNRAAAAREAPTFHADRIDLSTYDPDDRVAIEALLDQDRRDGVLPQPLSEGRGPADFQGQSMRFPERAAEAQRLSARLTDPAYVDLNAEEASRERQRLNAASERFALQRREDSLARGLARDARIREMRAQRNLEFQSGNDRDDEDRPRLQRPPPLPFFQTHARPRPPPEEPTRFHFGLREPIRIPSPPADPPPFPEGWVSMGGGEAHVNPDVANFGRQGLVVGARPNNRLRDQVAARANARTARQIVEQATADVKKQIEPRLKKNDDVDAAALTADDNSCVICTSSHVTTMLFPCLHYQFCSGCIAVWKDEQKHEGCPICRAKIEMVIQPMGKISLEDLRKRNRESSVSSAPISSGIFEPVPTALAAAPAPAKQASKVIDLVEDKKDPEEAKEPPSKKGRASKRKPAPKKKK